MLDSLYDLTRGMFNPGGINTPPAGGTGAQPVTQPLLWDVKPPTQGVTGKAYPGSWKGGKPPYHATITNGNILLNTTDTDTSMTLNVDGTNQPIGTWHWSVKDAAGTEITAMTVISQAAPVGKPWTLAVLGGETAQRVGYHHTLVTRRVPADPPISDFSVTWSSSDPDVMTVTGSVSGFDATMVGIKPGTADAIATLTYIGSDGYDTSPHTARQTITIIEA